MQTNRINTDIENLCFVVETMAVEKKYTEWLKIGISLFLFGATIICQVAITGMNMAPVISYLQVMISVCLAVTG
ncbi:hypothetical protein GH810_00300 [Acetobacterium paludosum]|uniref:Uncharacterized protein n=1 Tax=Acetobacterium paludosum TaxID=52693 RepID=A0A923HS16_9FIRM|nr:hypothetical protein [Acetobacterium paludosum]MBC3886757.1 hypothetical protein [Acetobacterium paludosum]